VYKKDEKRFDIRIKKNDISIVMNTTNNQTNQVNNPYETQTLIGRYVSKDAITLIFSDDTVAIDKSNPRFNDILQLCKEGKYADAAALSTIKQQVNQAFDGTGVEVVGGEVLYNGSPLHNVLCERILDILREGLEATGLVKFLENLMKNPSYTAVQELYLFLEANKIPITEDGHFLAWKKIRNDWKDIYSGSVDYSIGAKPTMPRNQVDENRHQTCSRGLHVAGWDYLPHFGSSNTHSDRVIIVKVNPADVVAVPSDYNNAKMRVATMEVLREYKDRQVEADEFSHSVVSSNGEALYTQDDLDEAFNEGYDTAYEDNGWWTDEE
jgi:hypothetical protein